MVEFTLYLALMLTPIILILLLLFSFHVLRKFLFGFFSSFISYAEFSLCLFNGWRGEVLQRNYLIILIARWSFLSQEGEKEILWWCRGWRVLTWFIVFDTFMLTLNPLSRQRFSVIPWSANWLLNTHFPRNEGHMEEQQSKWLQHCWMKERFSLT